MGDFQRADAFRKDAAKRGLLYQPAHDPNAHCFVFDLNQGEIRSTPEPKTIMDLVLLARQYAPTNNYGEHNALLQLVAGREEINANVVHWRRPYHVHKSHKQWVSLKEWLEENQQNPSQVFREINSHTRHGRSRCT